MELKIGILQQHNTADRKENMARLAAGIRRLAAEGAELVVLQELHNGLYFCQTENVDVFDQSEPIPGPSTANRNKKLQTCFWQKMRLYCIVSFIYRKGG